MDNNALITRANRILIIIMKEQSDLNDARINYINTLDEMIKISDGQTAFKLNEIKNKLINL